MLKQLKPDNLYFVIRINELYAEKIFNVLKEEQTKLGDWSEGDITFREWVFKTFGQDGLDYVDSGNSDI